jgi:D-amino peptidase
VRVHIITDMEGVSGIVRGPQTHGGAPMYEEGRKLYTEEINAAVRGAKAAGATEIVVMDCHGAGKGWTFNSLVPEDLDPACEFVVQDECTGNTGDRRLYDPRGSHAASTTYPSGSRHLTLT